MKLVRTEFVYSEVDGRFCSICKGLNTSIVQLMDGRGFVREPVRPSWESGLTLCISKKRPRQKDGQTEDRTEIET